MGDAQRACLSSSEKLVSLLRVMAVITNNDKCVVMYDEHSNTPTDNETQLQICHWVLRSMFAEGASADNQIVIFVDALFAAIYKDAGIVNEHVVAVERAAAVQSGSEVPPQQHTMQQ
jgi:hypothetical protein